MSGVFVRETVIRVTGVFDREAAERLRLALTTAWAAEPGTVLVDFSLAREVSDVGLAALLEPLLEGDLRLRFRGLTHRHQRMLRFLGAKGKELRAAENDLQTQALPRADQR